MDNVVIEAIGASDLANDAGWWQIYDDSFPEVEREPRVVILQSLASGIGIALRARVGRRTVGISTVHLLASPPAAFLVYIAADSNKRTSGIGALLFNETARIAYAELRSRGLEPIGMVWEVEDPSCATDERDLDRRTNRIDWFVRRGGRLVDRPYLQPPVDGTTAVPMLLMMLPEQDVAVLDEIMIESIVRAIYLEKYAGVNGIDPRVLHEQLRTIGFAA